jgi:hypothetical protein
MTICKAWEIWPAHVVFDDAATVKKRPVLIVPMDSMKCVQIKMTGTPPRDQFEHLIVFWKEAGLSKATTIRTSKISRIQPNNLIRKIGDLLVPDIVEFKNKYIAFQKSC